MSQEKFKRGDRCFARMKDWPPWPAIVTGVAPGKLPLYNIRFYGTYDQSTAAPSYLIPFNPDSKTKYGHPSEIQPGWDTAMTEIENQTPIGRHGPLQENAEEEEFDDYTRRMEEDFQHVEDRMRRMKDTMQMKLGEARDVVEELTRENATALQRSQDQQKTLENTKGELHDAQRRLIQLEQEIQKAEEKVQAQKVEVDTMHKAEMEAEGKLLDVEVELVYVKHNVQILKTNLNLVNARAAETKALQDQVKELKRRLMQKNKELRLLRKKVRK